MDTAQSLSPGFEQPTYDAIKVFRAVADAMAHPGQITPVLARPPAPAALMPATAALCLALLDFETPLWIQQPRIEVTDYLRFHCGCPLVSDSQRAAFALLTDTLSLPGLDEFNAGESEYPERSATLLIQVAHLTNGAGVQLSGPGLLHPVQLDAAGLPAAYWREVQASRVDFPCGVDIVFVAGASIAALPRTTQVQC